MVDLQNELKRYFGYDQLRPGQTEVMQALLAGESALAVFPTGSGKSLCFQLPAILMPGLTVVVSPLLALMKDQVDFLLSKGIPSARLDSTLSAVEVSDTVNALKNGRLKLLYLSPEKLSSQRWRTLLSSCAIDLMVVDEAHCISEWGHNFRPDYMKLANAAIELGAAKVLGLTATATPAVIQDICRSFRIKPEHSFCGSFHRSELTMNFRISEEESQKRQLLLQRIKERPAGATLVYVTLQKTAQEVADFLQQNGVNAVFYHAGMKNEDREQVQQRFMEATDLVVVATIAFGMGVDKSNIRYVYHYNMPKSIENYIQETGRGARDGENAICEMLASPEDITILQNFVYGDTPDPDNVSALLDFVMSQPDNFDVSLYELAGQFDIRTLVLATFFTYLELEGVIVADTPFYSSLKIGFLEEKEKVIGHFSGERAQFLQNLFAIGKQGRKLLTIDIAATAAQIGQSVDRINAALDYLADKRMISTRVSGLRQRYHFLNRSIDGARLKNIIFEKFIVREEREIGQIERMIGLVKHNGCKVSYLLQHFGEQFNDQCGHCSFCEDKFQPSFNTNLLMGLSDKEAEIVLQASETGGRVLASPRAMSRFLCGITSPAASRFKVNYVKKDGSETSVPLTKTKLFGIFAKVPFEQVLAFVSRVNRVS